jgi:2-keto-myo-inositol isomerase
VAQMKALVAAGYDGPYSFEPFAPEIHGLADPAAALGASIDYVKAQV